jgi:translation initiation factor IF-2
LAEKMRVHILARELNVPSKVIITKCKAEGLDISNHMSTLTAGLAATIREWFSDGQHDTTLETSGRVDLAKVRIARKRKPVVKKNAAEDEADTAAVAVADEAPAATVVDTDSAEAVEPVESSTAASTESSESSVTVDAPQIRADVVDESATTETAVDSPAPADPDTPAEVARPAAEAPCETPPEVVEEKPAAKTIVPAGPQNVPAPTKLKGPRVVRYEPVQPHELTGPPRRRPSVSGPPPGPRAVPGPVGESGGPPGAPGSGPGRRRGRARGWTAADDAKRGRGAHKPDAREDAASKLKEWRDRDLAERQERISDATGRRIHARRSVGGGKHDRAGRAAPKTDVTIQEPIRMKSFCSEMGISLLQIRPALRREYGIIVDINSELTSEMAEFIALEHGINLTLIPAKTALDELAEEFKDRKPKLLKSRPAVVTFLGHVDHGKTSLLDAIKTTHVASGEDGGITQHIGAYHIEHPTAGHITFLDTPGHAAFTAMRARGAHLTDIIVLVVAADDGVMPQTVEAINHAKASGVPIVVALNKIDLGTQNVQKIYGQLTEHELTPAGDWGGEVDVIHTAATTGEGIDELIEHLTALGEVLDLKADVKGTATGTVIEAETKEGVGAVVRVLVQDGLLRTGKIVVCGNAFGKVRAIIDDRGKKLKEAGPSIPVEIWGLDEVPVAGDKFYELNSMQRAKAIAAEMRHYRVGEARVQTKRLRSLEEVFQKRDEGAVPELNIIIKADVDGSLDALRTMLEKIPSDEIRLTIRHSAVGAVNDSDVLLADASDAIVVAYRVAPAGGSKRLAEEKSVDIRSYKVIYEVADDIKKALEGLLAPEEKEESRATCEVREVFRVSKIGVVAGCMVASGVINRNNVVRLIRDGVVVRQGCKIGSLRRFKDDAREVRAGLECGIRIDGFDDVKPGDTIEAYEIIKLARTL